MLQRSSQTFFLQSGPDDVVQNTGLVLRPDSERFRERRHVGGPSVDHGGVFEEEDGTVARGKAANLAVGLFDLLS